MKRVLLVALLGLLLAGPATALTNGTWEVVWDMSEVKTIGFTLANDATVTSAGIAPAAGWFTPTGGTARYIPRVYCVDVFKTAANNSPYGVTNYQNPPDAETGWTTPGGDSDEKRTSGSLKRVAYLANKHSDWVGNDAKRARALNVALWYAAYYGNFTYNSGLDATEVGYYNSFKAEVDADFFNMKWSWFDNSSNDGSSYHQDFIEPIPEPATLLLLGGTLLGSSLWARRKRHSS